MRLASGSYLGLTTCQVSLDSLTVSYTTYEAMQEQPWHVHEHPTFFIHLLGDHVDGGPEGDQRQSPLSATYHPASEYHRSRIGSEPVFGLNIQAEPAWLEAYGIDSRQLGKQRILDTAALRDASLRSFAELFLCSPMSSGELQDIVFGAIEPFVEGSADEARTPSWLRRAEDRLHSDFRSPLLLRDLAEEGAVHSVYFARVFRRRHGCSVSDYIQRLRLQVAVDLILSGTPIGVASAEAGFADQFHLSRLLKRHYRLTPSDLKSYRRSALNGSNRS